MRSKDIGPYNYSFQRDKSRYLKYRNNIPNVLRHALLHVKNILGYVLEKQREEEELNRKVLVDLGLDPDSDISSLDAFYKKEFRQRKYMFLCKPRPTQDLPEPKSIFRGYCPTIKAPSRFDHAKDIIRRIRK